MSFTLQNTGIPQNNLALATGRTWFNVQNSAKGVAEINIIDDIGGWGVSASYLCQVIKGLADDCLIKVHIFSPGGDVMEGNEIYNSLKAHKGGVEISVGALCASIATVIACAGSKVSMAANGLFMIHNPWVVARGESADLVRMAGVMDKMKLNITNTYASKTGKPLAELAKMMDDETWMTAEEAKAAGFVNDIIDVDPEGDDIQARFDFSGFRNAITAFARIPGKQSGTVAASAASGNAPVPPVDEVKPKKEEPSTQSAAQPTLRQSNLLRDYMNGKTRVFNSILTGAIMASAGMIFFPPDTGLPAGAAGAGNGDDNEKAVAKLAKELYTAKLKRDEEIDTIVQNVLTRDKKDFSALALKFKKDDKTPDEFARALTSSDEFKPSAIVGSGVEVVGVVGLPKGTPGEVFVATEGYKAVSDRIRNQKPKDSHKVTVETYDFMNQALSDAARIAGLQGMFQNLGLTSTGLTSIEKLPGITTLGVRALRIKDLLAPGSTNSTTIRYMREVSVMANGVATTVAEGAAKPSVGFELEEVDASVKKIAAWTKVPDELFADFLAIASYINVRLPYFVERTEEDQLLTGNGTGTNILGIMNTPGVQTRARSWDLAHGRPESPMDAIYKAFTLVRWGNLGGTAQGGFEPDGIVLHPLDWDFMRLSVDANGQYFAGGPFTGAYGTGGLPQFEMLWQKPVVLSPAIAQGTALVGAFHLAAQYFQRQGMTIDSTNMDQDDFIKNLTTIRAELRLALAVYRPQAFAKVTLLGTLPVAP